MAKRLSVVRKVWINSVVWGVLVPAVSLGSWYFLILFVLRLAERASR